MTDAIIIGFLGVAFGLQYGLAAMGLVLIFRMGRYVNFAQGQLGLVAAVLLGKLVLEHGWPYWPALLLSLLAGVLAAAGVERLLTWRLFDASRLVVLLATVGMSQLFLVVVPVGIRPRCGGHPRARLPPAVHHHLAHRCRRPRHERHHRFGVGTADRGWSPRAAHPHDAGQGHSRRGVQPRRGTSRRHLGQACVTDCLVPRRAAVQPRRCPPSPPTSRAAARSWPLPALGSCSVRWPQRCSPA